MAGQSTAARGGTAGLGSVVGFLVVMEFASGLLQGWYPPLLGSIGERFDVTNSALNWVVASYMLATAVCVPVVAKLGDRYGHRKMLAVAAALVAVGSVVVALAPSFGVLLLGRIIQAPLAAFLPLEFAIVRNRNPEKAGAAIGMLVGALSFGAAMGSLCSGALADATSVGFVLWFPAIMLALCVPVVIFLVPETDVRVSGRIDWAGASLLGVGLVLFLVGISNGGAWGWGDPRTLGSITLGLAVLAGWVVLEKRVTDPLIDIDGIFRAKIALPILVAFLFGAQFFGSWTPLSLFATTDRDTLGFGLGLGMLGAGAIITTFTLAAFVSASFGDRLARATSHGTALAVGGLIAMVAYTGMALAHDVLAVFVVWAFLAGLGNGLLMAVLPTVVVMRAPSDSVGIASAVYNTARTVAGAVAGAFFALVMGAFVVTSGSGSSAQTVTDESGYVAVWVICAVLALAVAVLGRQVGRVVIPVDVPVDATPAAQGTEPARPVPTAKEQS